MSSKAHRGPIPLHVTPLPLVLPVLLSHVSQLSFSFELVWWTGKPATSRDYSSDRIGDEDYLLTVLDPQAKDTMSKMYRFTLAVHRLRMASKQYNNNTATNNITTHTTHNTHTTHTIQHTTIYHFPGKRVDVVVCCVLCVVCVCVCVCVCV
jgi:hypothetical protein